MQKTVAQHGPRCRRGRDHAKRRAVSRASQYVNYGLIAVAIALGVVAVVDRDRPTTKEQASRAGLLLRVFRPDEITRVTVDRRGEKIEIVREGDGWKMTSPRLATVDFLAMTSFFNALQGARSERALGDVKGGERAQLGLDAPRARVEIAMKGVMLRLALGGVAAGAAESDAGGLASYVEVAPYGDDKGGVFVVAPDVAAMLDRGADAFREPSLLGRQSTTFSRIEVKRPDGVIVLARGANGSWRLADGKRASADAVDGLLLALYEMKAAPFVPDNTPVDPSKGATVEITSNGEKLTVSFGGACPADPKSVVARREGTPPIVACIPSLVAERVAAPPSLYLDTHAFWLQPGSETAKTSEIESVLVEVAGVKTIEGERRGDGLHLRVPSDEQVDKDATDRYFGRLAAVTGVIVTPPDLAPLGLAPAAGRVVIRRTVSGAMLGPVAVDSGSAVVEQVIEVGTPVDVDGARVVHIRRLDDGVVLRVPIELAQPLRASAAHELRSPNLLSLTGDSLTRVHVRPADGALAFDMVRKSGFWELVSPAGFGADASTAGNITSTLATMLCLRWAAEKDDGSFGFEKPSVVIDLEREAKPVGDAGSSETSLSIELGKESPDANGGVFARVRGRDPVCVLPIGKRDILLKPPVDYRNVGFDPSQTPRIDITVGKRHRVIQYSDATKAWSDASDAGSGGDFIARKLADAVRGMRAEGLVHLGPARPTEGFDTPVVVLEGSGSGTNKKKILVGGPGKLGDLPVLFVRVEGVDATWAVTRGDVEAITSLL